MTQKNPQCLCACLSIHKRREITFLCLLYVAFFGLIIQHQVSGVVLQTSLVDSSNTKHKKNPSKWSFVGTCHYGIMKEYRASQHFGFSQTEVTTLQLIKVRCSYF